MKASPKARAPSLALLAALGVLGLTGAAAHAAGPRPCPEVLEVASDTAAVRRCILWKIVHNCTDPGAKDFCSNCPTPPAGTPCASTDTCRRLEVWAEEPDFIAIKDSVKMCGCGGDFIHGLALSRRPATGVEDPRTLRDPRLAGAWAFAWKAALARIGEPEAIVLAANSASHRTQDQLHIHLTRLAPGARDALDRLKPGAASALEILPHVRAAGAVVKDLRRVWPAAARSARLAGFAEYGVAVIKIPGGWLAAAVDGSRPEDFSPEKAFALYECPEKKRP